MRRSAAIPAAIPAILLAAQLGGCRSVQMPEENYYRIALPEIEPLPQRSTDVLRIDGFELASTLSSDRLLIASNAVQLRAYEFHRWLNPLERLVQDAWIVGLTRARAFADVKGPTDGPGETVVLTGRILDFQQVPLGAAWGARVTLELRLLDARKLSVVLHDEFTATATMPDASPVAAVRALSAGMRDVLQQFVLRCGELGLVAAPARPGK